MEKYKYTGPTMLIGEHDEYELRSGMEVWAEVNINVATIKGLIRGEYELMLDPLSYEVSDKYLEPVKPETIDFTKDNEEEPDKKVIDEIMEGNVGAIPYLVFKDLVSKGSPAEILERMRLKEGSEDDHEVGGDHYKMAIEPWDYISIVQELTDTYKAKNHDYGNSFTELFSECGMTYAYEHLKEKINRIKSLMSEEAKVKDEKMEDSLKDLANYAILTIMELRKEKKC